MSRVDVLATFRYADDTLASTGVPHLHALAAELDETRAAVVELIEAARLIEKCAIPVSTEIDPRGYTWSTAYLNQALPILRAALEKVSK